MSDNGNRIDFNNLFNNQQNGYGGYGYQPPRRQPPQAILSMIFGIASLVMSTSFLSAASGIAFGIMALVMRKIYHKHNPRCGMTKAGLICGIIGIVLSGIVFISGVILISIDPSIMDSLLAGYYYY
jgi:hypothetical protein